MIAAYREPDRVKGRTLMAKLIDTVSAGVPAVLREVSTLGRTLNKRAADILAYFDHPERATAPPKRSTADSSTSAAPPSGSGTSPTMSHEHCSKPADSDRTTPWIVKSPLGSSQTRV